MVRAGSAQSPHESGRVFPPRRRRALSQGQSQGVARGEAVGLRLYLLERQKAYARAQGLHVDESTFLKVVGELQQRFDRLLTDHVRAQVA